MQKSKRGDFAVRSCALIKRIFHLSRSLTLVIVARWLLFLFQSSVGKNMEVLNMEMVVSLMAITHQSALIFLLVDKQNPFALDSIPVRYNFVDNFEV